MGTPEQGPLDPNALDYYDRDGFLQFEELLGPQEEAELRAEVDRLVGDPEILRSERTIREPTRHEVRSVFEVHRISPVFADLFADERLAGVARQLLGSETYIHQSRINRKPGFRGREFYWHSDSKPGTSKTGCR